VSGDWSRDFSGDFGPAQFNLGLIRAIDIIQDALEKLGKYAAGQLVSSADLARGLIVLNDMMASWINESLITYAILEQHAVLTAFKGQYTIGPGGDLDMVRPLRVIPGPGAAYLVDSNNNRYPVEVVPRDTWNQIWNLVSTTSNLPNVMFYDPQLPLGIINLYPLYNGDLPVTLYWDSYIQDMSFLDAEQQVYFPLGYVKAIKDNLAVDLFPYFKGDGETLDPVLERSARMSKMVVKRTNLRQNYALYDPELSRNQGRPYNIYSDTYR
jgi:hypothetical protein